MAEWIWFAVAAAILYGLHQIFTKFASDHIESSYGALIVEVSAALSIILYIIYLKLTHKTAMATSQAGLLYSVATGVCVGAGTILFFLLFQKGGPLSAVPVVLAGGAALMAIVGFVVLKEPFSWAKVVGVFLSLVAMFLLFYSPVKK